MGPGRWGSRGDIKLGVKVSYSDISNTAMLVEIARQKGNYLPDLSFGTHFFQDLVEAEIRYLPLYPDEPGRSSRRRSSRESPNILSRSCPSMPISADTVKVIDVPEAAGRTVLRILMNADLDEAVGLPGRPAREPPGSPAVPGRRRRRRQEPLGLAARHGRAHRRPAGRPRLRGQGHVCHRQHQERHGRPAERYRPARPLQGTKKQRQELMTLVRRLEPEPGGDELPEDRLQERRALDVHLSPMRTSPTGRATP